MNKGILKSISSFFVNASNTTNDMTHLRVGDPAPYFKALNEHGKEISLSDFRGKKLALFFYPADNTPACTAAACSLRDNYADLKAVGIEMLGVSPDSTNKHQKFIDKFNFPFSLIADEDLAVLNAYGVWGWKKFMGREYDGVHRTTFLIDENGIIEQVFQKVITKTHAQQIMESLEK
jgi:thioredoxin-dependent peroxiredoxin